MEKASKFIGKEAAAKASSQAGGAYRLRNFILETKDADVIGDEPIFYKGEIAGWVTSGGYAHASGVSMAMGYVRTELAEQEDGWSVELLAEMLSARMQKQPLFDSNASRMRS